jgi:hypothetical protein
MWPNPLVPLARRSGGLLALALAGLLGCAASEPRAREPARPVTVIWAVDNAQTIGGFAVTREGNPSLADDGSKALCFGGERDAALLDVNPLRAQPAFTVAALFKPRAGTTGTQVFLHLEDETENRVLMEARPSADGRWYLHSFVRLGPGKKDLENPQVTYGMDDWYWVALTYADGVVRQYVNGREQASGPASLEPMGRGDMAIGSRITKERWFKGCVKELRFANTALPASELAPGPSAALK